MKTLIITSLLLIVCLNTIAAQNMFVQLLDDAFLHSELSSNDYLSPGKDILKKEERE